MTPTVIVHPMESLAAAGKGLAHASAIARCHGAVLHVVYAPPWRSRSAADAGAAERLAERLHQVVAVMGPRPARVVAAVLDGDPVRALSMYAREQSADLIVMERPRRPGRYWSARGSAGAIGRAAGCPVLAVPWAGGPAERLPDGMFRRIVSAVDFSDASARALHHALTVAQQSGGRITLLHVRDGCASDPIGAGRINRTLDGLVPAGARAWCDVRVETVAGSLVEVIVGTAQRRGADLVVLGTSPRTTWDGFLAGSAAGGVLRRASCPVLIVPGPADVSVRFDWRDREREPAAAEVALPTG
jgi:nucleotide-binding universal stress UspA family protein